MKGIYRPKITKGLSKSMVEMDGKSFHFLWIGVAEDYLFTGQNVYKAQGLEFNIPEESIDWIYPLEFFQC